MRAEWGLFQGSWADTWSQNARDPERNNKGHCFETFSLRSNIFNLGVKAMFSGSTPISPSVSFLMAGDGVREMGAGVGNRAVVNRVVKPRKRRSKRQC